MLERLTGWSANQVDSDLRHELAQEVLRLSQQPRRPRAWVAKSERQVAADPARAFRFDRRGVAKLTLGSRSWSAGHFAIRSIRDLRASIAATRPPKGPSLLHALVGISPLTDIGYLQAEAGQGSLFQVASQFNCLESPGPHVRPVVTYFDDPTQGPRASMSAFPATLLRHYAAPARDGQRFVQQTDGPQIDLLESACGRPVCRNGYFTGEGLHAAEIADALDHNFEEIELGVHDEAEVVYGANWDGDVRTPVRIGQVFTSTVAGGGYGGERFLGTQFERVCRQLLRAAYLGTLLAAQDLGRQRVVLTLVGGGVFQNPLREVWQAILWAFDQLQDAGLEVVVNAHGTLRAQDLVVDVQTRGGRVFTFDAGGFAGVAE
jgi:hypothetical protein